MIGFGFKNLLSSSGYVPARRSYIMKAKCASAILLAPLFLSTQFANIALVAPIALADESADSLKYAQGLSGAFEKVAGVITPSVVTISSVTKVKFGKRAKGGTDPLEPFREFFGDDLADRFGGMPEGYSQQGMGTGVVVDKEGHILTNNHVVEGADEVTVRLNDGRTFNKAKVVGTDPRSDLAVIQITATNLTPATLGESSGLRIGEWVVAAGNPFGLDNSITAGIVSAKGRSFMGGSQYEDFIQTDAAINPGNSGGPLVNLKGEVIGINTAIFSRSGGYMGIGFAIPIDMAKNVMNSLITSGKVTRGWLGVAIQPVTEQAARSFKYEGIDGVLVGGVEPGGPADDAGLKQGDIIINLNGEKIKNVNQLRNAVAAVQPGKKVNITYFRDGKEETTKAKVGELPSEPGERVGQSNSAPALELGISVENLKPELAQRLGSKKKAGVVVNAVKPGSIAETAGLRARDIIVSVNGKKVKDISEFETEIKAADGKQGVRLVVETQGMEHFVFLEGEQ